MTPLEWALGRFEAHSDRLRKRVLGSLGHFVIWPRRVMSTRGREMSAVRVVGWLKVKPNKLGIAKDIVTRLVATTREKDRDTLAYDYYIDESRGTVVAHEHYRSGDGFVAHMANIRDFSAQVSEVFEVERIEVYGEVSGAMASELEAYSCSVYKTLITL